MRFIVLTRQEKNALIFVLVAFVLGVTMKSYRARHPPSVLAAKITEKKSVQPHASNRSASHPIAK